MVDMATINIIITDPSFEVRPLAGPWLGAKVGVGPATAAVVVVWRPQTVTCCGNRLRLAGADAPPIWHENEGRDGDAVHAQPVRCDRCGQYRAPEVVVVDDWGMRGDWGEDDWFDVVVATSGAVHIADRDRPALTACGRWISGPHISTGRLPRRLVSCPRCP